MQKETWMPGATRRLELHCSRSLPLLEKNRAVQEAAEGPNLKAHCTA